MLRRLLASFRRVPGVVGAIVVDDQWAVTATALEMEQDWFANNGVRSGQAVGGIPLETGE